MSEVKAVYQAGNILLRPGEKRDILDAGPPDIIQVSRAELEQEHVHLMARIQQLRRLLGFPPLPTGSYKRRQHE